MQADAFLALTRIQRAIEQRLSVLFEAEGLSDVTPAQANALMILFQERRPLTARVLAGHMALSEVTVGRFVRALEAAGWVRRDPDPTDHRAMLIRPTKKAYRALPRFIRISNQLLDEVFEGLDESAVRRIARTTERLRRNLGGERGA